MGEEFKNRRGIDKSHELILQKLEAQGDIQNVKFDGLCDKIDTFITRAETTEKRQWEKIGDVGDEVAEMRGKAKMIAFFGTIVSALIAAVIGWKPWE